jgi:hypothetical protein
MDICRCLCNPAAFGVRVNKILSDLIRKYYVTARLLSWHT